MTANEVALCYLVASILFILALRGLSHPRTARRGNLLGMVGMALAIVTTFAITNRIDMARLGMPTLNGHVDTCTRSQVARSWFGVLGAEWK